MLVLEQASGIVWKYSSGAEYEATPISVFTKPLGMSLFVEISWLFHHGEVKAESVALNPEAASQSIFIGLLAHGRNTRHVNQNDCSPSKFRVAPRNSSEILRKAPGQEAK